MTVTVANIHEQQEQGIRALASWWLARLQNPKFDNGGRDFGSALASVLADKIVEGTEKPQVTEEEFYQALQRSLDEDAKKWYPHTIGTDYHPDGTLARAMAECKISDHRAPWKTMTWIHARGLSIVVSGGYQAPHEVIYRAPCLVELAGWTSDQLSELMKEEAGPPTVTEAGEKVYNQKAICPYAHDRYERDDGSYELFSHLISSMTDLARKDGHDGEVARQWRRQAVAMIGQPAAPPDDGIEMFRGGEYVVIPDSIEPDLG